MEYNSDMHRILYSSIGGYIHVFLMLIFTLFMLFPFWVAEYVPILMMVPFNPVYFMIGSYCLAIFNKGIIYITFHMIFSLLSLASLVWFTIEYSSSQTAATRYSGSYCYPQAYGCEGARTIINVTYSGSTEFPGEYDSTGLDILVVWSWIWFAISLINWLLSLILICEYATFTRASEQSKSTPKPPKDYLCTRCSSNRDFQLVIMTIMSNQRSM